MTDIAIRVENLGKMYPSTPLRTGIGRNGAGKTTLTSASSVQVLRQAQYKYFDRLSTGLKILSHITEPTEGRADTSS